MFSITTTDKNEISEFFKNFWKKKKADFLKSLNVQVFQATLAP